MSTWAVSLTSQRPAMAGTATIPRMASRVSIIVVFALEACLSCLSRTTECLVRP